MMVNYVSVLSERVLDAHEHINNVLAIPGNKIVAICDIQQGPIDSTLKHIAKFNVPGSESLQRG